MFCDNEWFGDLSILCLYLLDTICLLRSKGNSPISTCKDCREVRGSPPAQIRSAWYCTESSAFFVVVVALYRKPHIHVMDSSLLVWYGMVWYGLGLHYLAVGFHLYMTHFA